MTDRHAGPGGSLHRISARAFSFPACADRSVVMIRGQRGLFGHPTAFQFRHEVAELARHWRLRLWPIRGRRRRARFDSGSRGGAGQRGRARFGRRALKEENKEFTRLWAEMVFFST